MGYFWLFFLCASLSAQTIETFYGPLEVEEAVIIELIESPAFQRLKSIHQYGVAYYTTHPEEFTRYDHSLGVFAVLRTKGCPLKEQIAGLLHDVSHTAFSHVGDWIFSREYQTIDYQTSIHTSFLKWSGLDAILQKYGFAANELEPKEEFFPALDQRRPNLSADRIDYCLQGAYHRQLITYEEALQILDDLHWTEGAWVGTDPALIAKLVRFTLHMTEACFASARNHLESRWLADAILKGIEMGMLQREEIHFGTDDEIWNRLAHAEEPFIRERMEKILNADTYFCLTDPSQADLLVKAKFWGVDPWIMQTGQLVRLTSIDPLLAEEYRSTREKMERGWAIKFLF